MVKYERQITDGQLKFIEWIHTNHINDMESHQIKIVKTAVDSTSTARRQGYMNNSEFQETLNEIRDLYLREYTHSITK